MLQRLAEQMEYSKLLDKADECSDSCLRLAYCAAFGLSAFASSKHRVKKPFNPILGETFEYLPVDGSFKFVSEQVSHHPPISAGFAQNDHFEWVGDTDVKASFWGKSMEFKALGTAYIKLLKHKDVITYKRPTISIQNIIIGTMYVDYYGEMPYVNHTTGDTASITLKQQSWTGKNACEVVGEIKDKTGKVKYDFSGRWDTSLKVVNRDTKQETVIWTALPKGENYEQQYRFGDFTKQLNYLYEELLYCLCPTDSRLRPDQRALEYGDRQIAVSEKHRLEEKQRARRREMAAKQETHKAKWFTEVTDQITGERTYKYKGGYFEARKSGQFHDVIDIFT